MGKKYYQFLVLIGKLCQVDHEGYKLDLSYILNLFYVVLINLFYRLNFPFQLVEKDLFSASVVSLSFVECYFLSIGSVELV